MFPLFKRKKVSIHSVSIPDFNWLKVKDDNSIIQWINPEQSIAISINFFDIQPDIPTLKNIDILRGFYRKCILEANGGLIEVELFKKGKLPIIRTIFKIPQESSGITYLASLTLPLKTCSFVFKIQAAETGNSGFRETLVANKLISTIDLSSNETVNSNWALDPYDSDFKDGSLMNKSEQSIYDIDFPNHHLTRARQLLKQIEMNLQWTTELETISPFSK